jgi:hypothetical protein
MVLLILVMKHATVLRGDMDFIAESLEMGPIELLMLRTVEQFREVGIKLVGTTRTSVLTDDGGGYVANYARDWNTVIPERGQIIGNSEPSIDGAIETDTAAIDIDCLKSTPPL